MIAVTILMPLLLFALQAAAQERSWEDTRSMAEARHEIILLLIENKEFDQIPDAAEEIFCLKIPETHENLLVREAQIITDALLHLQQTAVAHQVLDTAIKCAGKDKVKARLFREKAYLFKKEGNSEEAMRYFKDSLELESKAQGSQK